MKKNELFASDAGMDGRAPLVAALLVLTCIVISAGVASAGEEPATPEVVGSVKNVSGEVFCLRNGEQLATGIGDYLYQGDVLSTGADSSMGVIFRDDTILSLGSRSQATIDQFVFDPSKGNMNFLVKVGKGTAQFISGQMAKISPESMAVETPLSTIGIRGTRFLVKVD